MTFIIIDFIGIFYGIFVGHLHLKPLKLMGSYSVKNLLWHLL